MPDSYGTSGGVEITDALIERLADEAERGFDHSRLHLRVRSQPSASTPVIAEVELPPDLSEAVAQRAARDRIEPSDVVRKALRNYLKV